MQNVMELLQYAESKNCAFLKESALDFIALNKVEAIEKLSFNDAPGTIAKDILIALSRGDKNEDEFHANQQTLTDGSFKEIEC
jgi:hypothetical protein